jgi:hypothetical protein
VPTAHVESQAVRFTRTHEPGSKLWRTAHFC